MVITTKLPPLRDTQTRILVSTGNKHFLISRIKAFDHGGWETMVFETNEEGNVYDWKEVYERRGWEDISDTVQNFFDLTDEEIMELDLEEGDEVV